MNCPSIATTAEIENYEQTLDQTMSDEKPKSPLSQEDQALWEKVQKTLDQKGAGKRGKSSAHKGQKKDAPEDKDSKAPTTEDFAALLAEGLKPGNRAGKSPSQSPSHSMTKAAGEAGQQTTRKKGSGAKPASQSPYKIARFSQQDSRQISSGRQQIEGMIDLHGHTQKTAEAALKSFLKRAQTDGKKLVLVITGKGTKLEDDRPFELGAPELGVLKRRVPTWLDEMSDVVVSYKPALKNHGGDGALYVRLRKLKP